MSLETKDNINPDHYKSSTSLECIEAMELVFGKSVVIDFCVCNAWKYIWRWKNKNGVEDLKKANWYVLRACESIYESSFPEKCELSEKYSAILSRMREYIEANNALQEENDNDR